MKIVKGTKKKGAVIKHFKTYGYNVIDYTTTISGRPVAYSFKKDDYNGALKKYNEIINSKK